MEKEIKMKKQHWTRTEAIKTGLTPATEYYDPFPELPQLIVHDNFIDDWSLINRIKNDKDFWKMGYYWWDGWWQSETTTLRHELIEFIYKDYCPFPIKGHGKGFEHWVGITTPEDEMKEALGQKWALAPHQDKDEDYWVNHPKGKNRGDHQDSIKTPMLGTVYYAEAPEEGGHLKIWEEYDFHKITEDTPYELIKPRENRLIVFDAGRIHAVEPVTKGIRKAVAINLWDPKPTTKMEND